MARTVNDIFTELLAEKANQADLAGLTSTSKAAVWRVMLYVVAVGIWIHEGIWDQYKLDLENIALSTPAGTSYWYVQEALKYQPGDNLTWNGSKYVYDPVDEANLLIKSAAVSVDGSQVNIKVAKDDGAGSLEKLTTGEKSAFTGYMEQLKVVGTNLNIISDDPDDFALTMTVYLDLKKIDSAGLLVSDGSTPVVINSINNYLSNLEFSGKFKQGDFVNSLMAVDGVENISISSIRTKFGGLSYSQISGGEYNSNAGYMKYDSVNSTIQFISDI